MSYRPKIKTNATGTISDLPLDAETVKGGTLHKTLSASDDTNFSSDKAVADYIDSKGYTTNEGTVTSVSAGTGLAISGVSTINPTVNVDSAYKLPTTTEWASKQDAKPDGTNPLISNNKIATSYIPDAILGQLLFGGTVNANTAVATLSDNAKSRLGTTSSTITLTNDTTAITGYKANEGIFYVVQNAGTFAGKSYSVGDWLISTGNAWDKVDNTDEVTSVQVQTGTGLVSSTSTAQTGAVQTTISVDSNYKLPTTTEWNAKVDVDDVYTKSQIDTKYQDKLDSVIPNTVNTKQHKFSCTWAVKTWTGDLTSFNANKVWTDGTDIFYSAGNSSQYKFNKSTKTWEPFSWGSTGLSMPDAQYIWTNGVDIYHTNANSSPAHYKLNKETMRWQTTTEAQIPFGNWVWTDGTNIYYSSGTTQKIYDKLTKTWSNKSWSGSEITSFSANRIWTDGNNVYYSEAGTTPKQYVLDKSSGKWVTKNWNGFNNFWGSYIWTDGEDIYCSVSTTEHYVLDKPNSKWIAKTWNVDVAFYGSSIWTDGEDIYYSNTSTQYVLNKNSIETVKTTINAGDTIVDVMSQEQFDDATGGTTPDIPVDIFSVDELVIGDNVIDGDKSKFLVDEYNKTSQIWDEQYRLGYYATNGVYNSGSTTICSTNYISVNSNTTYYFSNNKLGRICYYNSSKTFISYEDYHQSFTTPSNCAYIMFDMITEYGTTYKGDIAISLDGAIVHTSEVFEALGGSENIWLNGNKTLNMQTSGDHSIYWDDAGTTSIRLKAGKYSLIPYVSKNLGSVYFKLKNTSTWERVGNEVSQNSPIQFTLTQTTELFFYYNNSTGSVINNVTINMMLLEGTRTLPYKPRTGNIVFEANLEPKLLWQNPSPNSAWPEGTSTITVPNMSNYKYIIVAYKNVYTSTQLMYKKVNYNVDSSINGSFYLSDIMTVSGQGGQYDIVTRALIIDSSTTIDVGSGRYIHNGSCSVSNNYAIPIAVYGTNIL